jgi:phosphoadenosine phosphosulfate reductase
MNHDITTSLKRKLSTEAVIDLNKKYRALRPIDRIRELYKDFDVNEVMLTSSFAATSALFLKLFSEICTEQTIYFIDTGYHFEETHNYKKELIRLYNLKVKSISALREEHAATTSDKTWTKNPDQCCYVNKVKPLDIIKNKYTVWASGLMKWQSDHRASLDIFEMRGEILKFYPLLDVTKISRDAYIEKEKLPFHPLVSKGYHSIGCKHCTIPSEGRTGRWNNNPKTECGLHL